MVGITGVTLKVGEIEPLPPLCVCMKKTRKKVYAVNCYITIIVLNEILIYNTKSSVCIENHYAPKIEH